GPTETPTPELSPTPPADDFGGLPIKVEGGLNQRFETRTWAKGAPIDWEHGLFRLFPNTGDVQGFRFIGGATPDGGGPVQGGYGTGPGARFVWAGGADGRGHLLDRENLERSWSWSLDHLRLVASVSAGRGAWVVFEELAYLRNGTGRHVVLAPGPDGLRKASEFQIPPTGPGQPHLWSPDGSHLAIWSGGDPSDPQLHLIQASTGRIVESSHVIPPRDGKAAWPMNMQQLDRGFGGFLAVWGYPANTPTASPPREGQLFLWSGAWTAQGSGRVMPLEWTSRFSLDGQYHLFEAPLRYAYPESGEGVHEFWTAVSVSGIEASAPDWSMLSASIGYGDLLLPNPWLADSSGFVAMIRGLQSSGGSWDAYEYAIISNDGETITRIQAPSVPDEQRSWFRANPMRSPAPCPYDPDLIAFGRLELYNRRTGEWFAANITSQAGPDHLGPWVAGPGQMVFALPHGGHGGASPPILLTPKRVDGAPDPEFRFVVARTGDGLNLRTGGHTGTEVIGVIPDGTVVELAEDVKMPVGQRSAIQNEEGTWLYVKTLDGSWGWVAAAYLDWE
ncbi:MAG: SH3 domain-containing protein, partial [Dehalococcoidia bacterium]|nr:SH3 domain-containing protein [Dehalococcoidia bacterium]